MFTMTTKYFVKDLNTIEEAASLDAAKEIAVYWMELQKPLVEDADDETLIRWLHAPDMGLESGDVQVFAIERTETEWNVLHVGYSDDRFRELAIQGFKPFEVLSGRQQIIDEAEKRGLRN